MPFIKRGAAPAPSPATAGQNLAPQNLTPQDLATLLQGLSDPDAEARWAAARALGGRSEAVPALAASLGLEQSPRVREAIVTALVRVGDEASVAALLPYLRSADAAMRTATIEALQSLPNKTGPFLAALFTDPDSDVRILATELARNMPAAEGTDLLCRLLEDERHPNVCAAAVEVLAEIGTPKALPVLRACAERFAGTPFLPFALSTAIARIAAAES